MIILGASATAYYTVGSVLDAQSLVDHTQRVIDHIDRLLSNLREAEIGARTYLISGKQDDLKPYAEGVQAISPEIEELRYLTRDNAQQQRRLDALEPLILSRLDDLKALIAARQAATDFAPPAFADQIAPPDDRRGQIRRIVDEMASTESRLYQLRQQAASERATHVLLFVLLATALAAINIVAVLYHTYVEVQRRREAESRLIEANATLEQRVAERTAELRRSSKRLQELQADLLHASRLSSVGQMSAAIAHELNQPLSAVSAYVSAAERMLKGDPPGASKRLREILAKAAAQVLRAGAVIRRTRDFVEKRARPKNAERLCEVIREAIELVTISSFRGSTEIKLAMQNADAVVVIDRIQIQQVLVNLLRNATEAMENSSRKSLVISTVERGDRMIDVIVTDSGPGLAPEVAEKLFQPFLSTKTSGLGVGLSICRSIVEDHGGTIWADSRPGEGAQFHFSLRLAGPRSDGNAALTATIGRVVPSQVHAVRGV